MVTELVDKLLEIGNATAGMAGRFFYLSTKSKLRPYAEFFDITSPDAKDTKDEYSENILQVNFFHAIDKSAEMQTIAELFTSKVKTTKFNLPSYLVVSKGRQFTRTIRMGDIIQIVHQYKIELQKK